MPGSERRLVVKALVTTNLSRIEGQKLEESSTAPLFGSASPLDSLGLVALLIDIEELFAAEGYSLTLSDDKALSQRRSPYRDVPSLIEYIEQLLAEPKR